MHAFPPNNKGLVQFIEVFDLLRFELSKVYTVFNLIAVSSD